MRTEKNNRCDYCGATINHAGCRACGAPQCCPQCCRINQLTMLLEKAEKEGYINGVIHLSNYRPPSSRTHDGANTLNEIRAFADAMIEAAKHWERP